MKNKLLTLFVLCVFISCTQPVARRPVSNKASSLVEKSVLLNKTLIKKEEKDIKSIIASDSLNTYVASSNGFWYTYNLKSKKKYFPKFGDQLLYSFEVLNLKGELIYSAEENGTQSYVVDQQELIEGLRNGLKLMNEGDVVTFLFPSHKVFGYLGDNNKIGINQSLIYKVQLNIIKKKNESN